MISVAIPVLNEERTIEKCLYSLINQTIPPDEIIIIDNESDDKTVEIALKYTDKVFIIERSATIEELRKIGTEIAQGDIIFSTDGDCIAPIDWIEKMLKHFEDPEVVGVGGRYVDIRQQPIENAVANICGRIFVGLGGNSAFRKDAYIKSGGYESINGYFSDVLLFKNLRKVGKVEFDETILMQTYIEGAKWGFLPVMVGAGTITIIGLLIKKKYKTAGNILTFGGLGVATGEIAHQVGHNLGKIEIVGKVKKKAGFGMHHDLFGLLGIGATLLLQSTKTIKKQTSIKSYSFFTSLILQHLITEGTSLVPNMHAQRWAIVGG